MQHSPNDIKEKLLRALDKDNNVVDMVSVIEAIALLERLPITKDELEKTRLGKYINELRKKTKNESLAKRAKDLVRKWRKMILPQDTGAATLNGERASHGAASDTTSPCSIVTSHLPGPGPGVGGSKSSSPAMANHHHHRLLSSKGAAGLHAMSSPGYSQCSSTSTSPSLFAATMSGRLSNNKCDPTGALTSPYAARLASGGRFNTFKPVSPAPTTPAVGRMASTPSGAGSSSAKYPSVKSVSSPAIRGSPVVSARSAVIAGKKRPREDDSDHCDNARRSIPSVTIANSSSSPRLMAIVPKTLVNGDTLADNSMDSVRSLDSGELEGSIRESNFGGGAGATDGVADKNAKPKRKNSRRTRVEKCDLLKDKLASHLRVSKVKTTAELIQELKVRNSGSGSSTAVRTSGEQLVQDSVDYTASRKAAYSALLGTDEDVTRNKTELMKKFLEDSVGPDRGAAATSSSSSSRNHKLSHGAGRGVESLNGLPGPSSSSSKSVDETVAAILATLPPIRPDEIRWDSSSGDDSDDESPKAPESETVSEEQLLRLHDGCWEGVNGYNDASGGFRRWNESLAKTSFDGDVLHILPYVDIDD